MSSPFTSLQALSTRTRKITIALPEDILDSVPQWSPEQLKIRDVSERGHPFHGYKLELRPDAPTCEFTIRRLTAEQQKQCEKIVDRVLPPQKFELKPGGRPGEPPVNVPAGWDDENPEYRERLAAAKDDQTALVVLHGVDGLYASTEGGTAEEKVKTLRAALDQRLILYITNEIFSWGYSAGDPADFFTKASSAATTQS